MIKEAKKTKSESDAATDCESRRHIATKQDSNRKIHMKITLALVRTETRSDRTGIERLDSKPPPISLPLLQARERSTKAQELMTKASSVALQAVDHAW